MNGAQDAARIRRNHLLGLWAARRLGYDGGDCLEYANEVAAADTLPPDDQPVIAKIFLDFEREGVAGGLGDIQRELDRLGPIAAQQIDNPR